MIFVVIFWLFFWLSFVYLSSSIVACLNRRYGTEKETWWGGGRPKRNHLNIWGVSRFRSTRKEIVVVVVVKVFFFSLSASFSYSYIPFAVPSSYHTLFPFSIVFVFFLLVSLVVTMASRFTLPSISGFFCRPFWNPALLPCIISRCKFKPRPLTAFAYESKSALLFLTRAPHESIFSLKTCFLIWTSFFWVHFIHVATDIILMSTSLGFISIEKYRTSFGIVLRLSFVSCSLIFLEKVIGAKQDFALYVFV